MRKGKQRGRWFALAVVSAGLVMMILPVQAQEGDRIAQQFLNNVVQLTTTFSNGKSEYGFGFVIGERDNLLYVVTARHVVRKDDDPDVTTQQVQARFATDRGKTYPVVVLGVAYRDLDIALLEISRPFASYTWESRCLAATPSRGELVWFIGRNKTWWIPPDAKAGVIEEEPLLGELVVQLDGVMPGTSGAPLFTANGIVGMIVSDSAENVVVISLEIIRQLVTRRWNYPWGLQKFTAQTAQPAAPTPKPTAAPTVKPTAAPTQTPEPTPTNTPQPLPTAMLTIRSNVYEDQVFVDGEYYGATRLDLELPLGQHTIRIEKAGYLPFEHTLDLQAAYTLKATLEPEPTPTPTAKPTATPTMQPAATPKAKPTATPAPRGPAQGDVWTEPQTGMKFVWIEGGCFQMGSPDSEQNRGSDEGPTHEVCLDGFWMGKYEVTQAQWQNIMGSNPSAFKGTDRPVEGVSWNDAQEFIKKLKTKTGDMFRLPTEAEWEYACRAGTTTPFYFGNTISTDQANYNGNYVYGNGKKGAYRGQTTDVGSFPANAWGLYDMHGNVWEWCADWYDSGYYARSPKNNPQGPSSGESRLLRGGSWLYFPYNLRCAVRDTFTPGNRSNVIGLRLVRGR